MTSSGGRCRRPWSETGGAGGAGAGGVSTLKRLLSDLLQALQIQDSWRRGNSDSGRRQHDSSSGCSQLTADLTTAPSPACNTSTPTAAQCCSPADVHGKDVEVLPETWNTAPTQPLPLRLRSADDDDVDDDVRASACSGSPSSDVEDILESLRDTATIYRGDVTLRRVFSLEQELTSHHSSPQHDTGHSANCQGKPITAAATQPKRGNHEVEAEKMWTLPLARRMTPATIGKSMTRVLRRFNGIAQTSDDDVECCRSANNSVVNASASAGMMMTRDADCPADVVDRLSVTSPVGADVVQSVSEEDRSTEQQAVLAAAKEARTLYIDNGASVSACAANAAESRRLIEPTTQSGNCVPVPGPSNQAQSATAASPSTASTNEIRQPEPESSGIVCSKLEQLTGASPTVNDSTRRLMSRPAQRSSSGNGGDFASRRPPVQPRASPPGSSFQRRHSATQARTDYSLPLAGGFMTVMASRTSSCEVLVDDDDDDVETRLTAEDMVRWRRRHSGVSAVTRRSSSCASSLADDTESTAASETDSCTAAQNVDVDDLIAYSLLDSLLMRLRSPARDFPSREFLPRDSPRSLCGQRRPSSQMSMSWSSSDEDEADGKRRGAGVDVTAETSVLPSTISGRACSSLLSSLDDLASECCSDFELGSSLSQLILLTPGKIQPEKSPSGKTPRHPSASRNNGRLSSSAASLTELPSRAGLNQLHSYRRQWTENSSYVPPPSEPQRQCADTAGTPVKGHALMTDASVTELSAPIAASLPARVHVAKTSRIPKY